MSYFELRKKLEKMARDEVNQQQKLDTEMRGTDPDFWKTEPTKQMMYSKGYAKGIQHAIKYLYEFVNAGKIK